MLLSLGVTLTSGLALLAAGAAVSPAPEGFPFAPGDTVGYADVSKLKPWLPEPFWAHRRFFFWDGMQMEIGPPQRDYSGPEVYRAATERYRGQPRIGPEGTLEGYVAGRPFPLDTLDCLGDPDAGTKLAWNFVHRWQGFGARARFRYVYLDRGEVLPLRYAGTTSAWLLKHRPEPQFEENGGDVFENERRLAVIGFEVDEPRQAAGTRTLTYRYAESLGPPQSARPEDTWLYTRTVRRVRKVSETARSNAVAGTDFSFDDLFSFSGVPPQYRWRCVGEPVLLAPMNTRRLGYPYTRDGDYGPYGLSYANDRWELRRAFEIELVPKDPDHPYSKKRMWIDRQTMQPLFSAAYDRTGAVWKLIHHNHRWSEDDLEGIEARSWYPGWEAVPEPRDLRVVSDSIANVQTGTGNRLEFWDSNGSAAPLREIQRYVDVQRLRRGR